MTSTKKITVNNTEISVVLQANENDYICLTDMARYKDSERTNYIIQNWMRLRSTIEYLGVWEQLNNPDFKRRYVKKRTFFFFMHKAPTFTSRGFAIT